MKMNHKIEIKISKIKKRKIKLKNKMFNKINKM